MQDTNQMTPNVPLLHLQEQRCPPQDRQYHDWLRSEKENGGCPKVWYGVYNDRERGIGLIRCQKR